MTCPDKLDGISYAPSPTLFRAVALVSLLCFATSVIISSYDVLPHSEEMANAVMWHYYDAILPMWSIYAYAAFWSFATMLSVVGMLFFWRASRCILAAALVANLSISPFLGLMVYLPFEATLGGVAATLYVWLATVSFWSPLAKMFRAVPREKQIQVAAT